MLEIERAKGLQPICKFPLQARCTLQSRKVRHLGTRSGRPSLSTTTALFPNKGSSKTEERDGCSSARWGQMDRKA